MNYPKSKHNDIFAESLAEETILYDKAVHRAHSLNKTAALVWEAADGEASADRIAEILHRRLGVPADPAIVLLALEELEAAGLLETVPQSPKVAEHLSRREVAQRLALAGASAALLPFVTSVLAPTPAMASSEHGKSDDSHGRSGPHRKPHH